MTWILFIIFSCGPGCIEVTARHYKTLEECRVYEMQVSSQIAMCERSKEL